LKFSFKAELRVSPRPSANTVNIYIRKSQLVTNSLIFEENPLYPIEQKEQLTYLLYKIILSQQEKNVFGSGFRIEALKNGRVGMDTANAVFYERKY